MSQHREILAGLERLRSTTSSPTPEQLRSLIDAVEQAAEALQVAPKGSDPIATGIWWNHERTPALARLADALAHTGEPREAREAPGPPPTPAQTAPNFQQQHPDLAVVRALHQALIDNSPR